MHAERSDGTAGGESLPRMERAQSADGQSIQFLA